MPDPQPLGTHSAIVQRAIRLHRRRHRDGTGTFLAEGPQAVREAVDAGAVVELLTTDEGMRTFADIVAGVERDDRVSVLTREAMTRACDALNPQPVAAICHRPQAALADVVKRDATLLAALINCRDPGNVGTIIRIADAVGADGVLVSDNSVDPFGPKAVRASAGSIFHVPVVTDVNAVELLTRAHEVGLATLAGVAGSSEDIYSLSARGVLHGPALWFFGAEADGLPSTIQDECDHRASIPIFGQAESLNLSVAAAICLYESARAHRPVSAR